MTTQITSRGREKPDLPPQTPNATVRSDKPGGRQKNRRVEIVEARSVATGVLASVGERAAKVARLIRVYMNPMEFEQRARLA